MSDSMIESSAQRIFSQNVDRALLERFEKGERPAALWNLVVDSGFGVALASEAAGGIGETWSAAYPILRGLGYWQVPLPLAETMIGSMLLSMAGIELPEGAITLIEQGCDNTLAVSGTTGTLTVSGRANRVAWARDCRWAVLSTSDGRIALLDLGDAKTAAITPRTNHAAEPADDVALNGAVALACAANPLPGLTMPAWTLGAVARSAMMVGALEFALEQSIQYSIDRVQFGRPIGKNQAIQQQLAVFTGDVGAARMAALIACQDAPSSTSTGCDHVAFSAAVAKVRVGESATRATSIAHQVHGAIGFTFEHHLQYATRRLWAWREAYGSDAWWARKLGEGAIVAGSGGLWHSITQRRFDGAPAGAR